MKVDVAAVRPLLRDPHDGGALIFGDDAIRGETSGRTYRYCDGLPVLVDFDRSLLDEADFAERTGGSPVTRPARAAALRIVKAVLSPPKRSTAHNVKAMADLLAGQEHPTLLVVGGGSIGQGLEPLYDSQRIAVVGFDIYASPRTHFIADGHDIPLADASVDAVVVQAVLEHVLQPQRVVDEIWRVLRPGGLVYAETPFLQQVHEGPYDFTRFTESGHRYLFRRFRLIASGVSGGPGTQMAWSIDYLARSLFRSVRVGKAFKLLFFWMHWLDALAAKDHASDGASGFFLLGAKTAGEIDGKEIVPFYRGAQRA